MLPPEDSRPEGTSLSSPRALEGAAWEEGAKGQEPRLLLSHLTSLTQSLPAL